MKKFDNFNSNLEVLKRAGEEDNDNEFIISGIIDKFFIQYEKYVENIKSQITLFTRETISKRKNILCYILLYIILKI